MTELNRYSLRWRLLAGTAGLLGGMLVVLCIAVWQYANRAADLSYDRLLTGAALAILERVRNHEGRVELDLPYAALEILELAPQDKVYYRLSGPDGSVLTGYEQLPGPDHYTPSATPHFYNTRFLGEPLRVLVVSKPMAGFGLDGWVQLYLAHGRQARTELSKEILIGEVVVLALVVLIALCCLGYGISRTLRPLRHLSRELARRSPSELSPISGTGIREVEPLVEAIELYRSRLQLSLANMQGFIADASHQIRTALSAMQAELDIAEYKQEEADQLRARMKTLRHQHRRLSRLTNQLLAHALVTHRRDALEHATFNLNELLQEVLTEVVRDYAHTAVEFSYSASADNSFLQGDSISLKEAVRNLLDNALKYGPPDNSISLSLDHEGGDLRVLVEDRGPGIAPEDRARALERFGRLGTANAMGSGLGLSIVKTVVEAHGGRIALLAAEPVGLRVELRFPQRRSG
ncbi:sensor histidine kinase [Aestuariirhabdus litorea]|nr:sensor histidine kinase [Aestuariirhabdus litorea]